MPVIASQPTEVGATPKDSPVEAGRTNTATVPAGGRQAHGPSSQACEYAAEVGKLRAYQKAHGHQALNTLSIVIITRERWGVVHATLTRLARRHPDVAVTLVDDGSNSRCPYDPAAVHPGLEFLVRSQSAGYVVRCNQALETVQTPYVMCLDDDAYPADGTLDVAVQVLARNGRAFSLSLPVYNPVLGIYRNAPRYAAPAPCRGFFDCAYILKRDAFLALGGYRELIAHQGHTADITARAFLRGWHALHFPGCLVHHLQADVGRDFARMDYYSARSAVLWNDWFVPDGSQLQFRLRCAAASMAHALRNGHLSRLRGHRAGLSERDGLTHLRERMSREQFARWCALPSG